MHKLWEGLGYYSRARNLLRCAKVLLSEYGGVLPRTAEQLCALPGIGEYTAGAIASIAYGEPEPAVDGNVLRVVMRLLASDRDIADARVKREVRELLAAVYPSGDEAGMLTEAIMELGESICIPNGVPKCDKCPICKQCYAYQGQIVSLFPVKSPKKPRKVEQRTIVILTDGDRVVLRRRPKVGLLAGLYEPLNLSGDFSEGELLAILKDNGYAVESVSELSPAVHIFTHVEWHMRTYLVRIARGSSLSWEDILLSPSEIATSYAIPSAYRHASSYLQGKESLI